MRSIKIAGVNIQWPWSQLLLAGKKTVETRSYPLPKKYEGQWLAVIETPGSHGRQDAGINRARISGLIKFRESFQYSNIDQWLKDRHRHLVSIEDKQFGFRIDKEKWGWVVEDYRAFSSHLVSPRKKGIVFALECDIPIHLFH